ncbi:MAG: C25 family cysteine peptidase [candidate division WOR-3 bacterium]
MILLNIAIAGGMSFSFDFTPPALKTEGKYTVISGETEWTADSGAPSIPAYERLILLPLGMTAKGIRVKAQGGDVIAERARLMPSQSAVKIGDDGFIPESKEYYSFKGFLPGPLAELSGVGWFCGQAVAMLRLYPVQYSPAEGKVRFYSRIEVEIETEPTPYAGVYPKRMTALGASVREDLASAVFVNPEAYILRPAITNGPLPPENTRPRDLSTAVDYLLITDQALLPGFAPLLLYKNLMGIRTAVATTEWISSHYDGVDLSDKIRNFIREAYQEWGVVWVLLGGSPEHVPTRYVETGFSSEGESVVPCEWYYAGLDGSWNADGDAYYGECPTDSTDYLPEVFIGRAYARNLKEAELFSDKFFQYQFRPGPNVKRAIFIGPQLWEYSPQDGELVCEAIQKQFPDCIDTIEFYHRFGNIYLDTIFAELRRGTGFWVSVSHGSYDILHIGTGIFPETVDTLSNWDYMPVASVISCLVGAFDKGALMTNFATAPRGGFITSRSVSRNGYIECQNFDSSFYKCLFANPGLGIGGHDAGSRITMAPGAQYCRSMTRYLFLSYTTLGDPGLFPYGCTIGRFHITAPASLSVGPQSFTVKVEDFLGNDIQGASVVVYKKGEIYEIRQTDALGEAHFNDVVIPSAGPLLLGVHKIGYAPLIDTINVIASGPWLTVTSASPQDADRDGYAEAGETLRLSYVIKNGGSAPATGVLAKISSASPYITILDSQMILPKIGPNSSLRTLGFSMKVASPLPDSQEHILINFTFIPLIIPNDTVGFDTAGFDVFSPVLRKWVRQMDVDSLSLLVRFKPGISNRGWADAEGITLSLQSPSPGITIIDGSASVDRIPKRGYLEPWNTPDGFTFRLSDINALEGAELSVIVSDPSGPFDTLRYTIHRNLPATGRLWGAPDSAAVTVFWEPPLGGTPNAYLVYRAEDVLGPYRLISYEPPHPATFTDYTVQPYKIYYYRVCAVDSSFNPGPLSEPVLLATYLKKEPYWPIVVLGGEHSCPVMCDLDPQYPGNEMVVAGVDRIQDSSFVRVFAYHYDGTPVNGWPVNIPSTDKKAWIADDIAAGDIDGDGKIEIAIRVFFDDRLFVLRSNGTIMPGWPKWVGWAQDYTQTPSLADLDGDGKLEVICAQGDIIYAFRYDGTGFLDQSGIFFRHPIGGGGFVTPSVADLDQDGNLEIVAGYAKTPSSEIWALEANGTPLPGFPCYLQRSGLSPSIAVGDLIPNILGDEIVLLGIFQSAKSLLCIGSNGQILWNVSSSFGMEASPSLGDVDNDGVPEVIVVGQHELLVYDGDGTPMPAYGAKLKTAHYTSASAADVDGDGKTEYFFGDYGGFLYGMREGGYVEGFPIPLGLYNWAVPQLGDFDNDGRAEIIQRNANGFIYAFGFYRFPPRWSNLDWRTYKHDLWRTGWIGADSVIAKQEARLRTSENENEPPVLSWGPTVIKGSGAITLSLRGKSMVRFRVYDPTGRVAEEPCSGILPAGLYRIPWGKDLPSGVYFLRLELGEEVFGTKSLILR